MIKIQGPIIIEHNKDKASFLLHQQLRDKTVGILNIKALDKDYEIGEYSKELDTTVLVQIIFHRQDSIDCWIRGLKSLKQAMKIGKFKTK